MISHILSAFFFFLLRQNIVSSVIPLCRIEQLMSNGGERGVSIEIFFTETHVLLPLGIYFKVCV